MKIPKKITIAGKKYKIITKSKESGAFFDGTKFIISIGTKYKQDTLDSFLHEIIELILMERDHRYGIYRDEPSQNFRFVFNHEEFRNIIRDIAFVLKDMVK